MSSQLKGDSDADADIGLLRELDHICDHFEAAVCAGHPPLIEDLIADASEPLRSRLLRELIALEVAYRQKQGQTPDRTEYEARFPRDRHIVDEAFGNCRASELSAEPVETIRRDHSDTPSGRLEIRCPSCQTPMLVAVDTSLTELTCKSCGSHFSLVDQTQTTRVAPPLSELGRFELLERLGVGGFGSVWKARDKELDRTVAIKIPRQGSMTPEEQERFFHEARAVAQLHHPNIVSIHEVGRDGSSLYIVSDFFHGVTLDDWLSGQQLTSREAAELCVKIAEALDHAHRAGVVHRDLKPANILIDGDMVPHLMDFGLARRDVGEVTITADGQVLGTPAYMSPEQAQGEAHHADRRSDVYSLGVILYQLLTGERPFRGNPRMLVHQVLHDEPPSPRKLNANVARDLETIVLKCMEKEPAKRYQTAEAVADELRRYLSGKPILERPISSVAKTVRWIERNRAVSLFASLAIIALVTGTIVSIYFAIQERRQAERADINRINAEQNERIAEERLVASLLATGDAELALDRSRARDSYRQALQLSRELELSELPATTGLMASYASQVPPLLGADGRLESFGGFEGHDKCRVTVAFSPNGKQVISAGTDGKLKLWDVATGVLIKDFEVSDEAFYDVTISPDGLSVLTAGAGGLVHLWSIETGKVVKSFDGHIELVRSVAFSPNGKQLVSGSSDKTVRVWDTANGTQLWRFRAQSFVDRVAFFPDGTRVVASGEPDAITVWDTRSGKQLQNLSDGSATAVVALAVSPDGQTALTGGLAGTLILWDLTTGKAIKEFTGQSAAVLDVAYSPDGRFALSVSYDQTIRLWDVSTFKLLHTWRSHLDGLHSLAISPNGQFMIATDMGGALKLWSLQNRQDGIVLRGHDARIMSLSISSDGKTLLSSGFDKTLRLWDVETGLPLRVIHSGDSLPWGVSISPEMNTAISTHEDGSAKLWDLHTGKQVREFKGHQDTVTAAAFAPDGLTMLTASSDATIKHWEVETGKLIKTLSGHSEKVRSVAISPDGLTALSGSFDTTIRLWDISSGQVLHTLTGHKHWVLCVAFSGDGRLAVSGSWDRRLGLWDMTTHRNLYFSPASFSTVFGVAISPDSAMLLGGSMDGRIVVWDVAENRQLREFSRHSDGVTSMAFCPNDNTAFSASRDGTIIRWQFERHDRYAEFAELLPRARKALSSDPNNPEALAVFGRWYAFRGEFDWAIEFLTRARNGGANVEHLELARCYWQLSRTAEAAEQFRLSIEKKEAPANYLSFCLQAVQESTDE